MNSKYTIVLRDGRTFDYEGRRYVYLEGGIYVDGDGLNIFSSGNVLYLCEHHECSVLPPDTCHSLTVELVDGKCLQIERAEVPSSCRGYWWVSDLAQSKTYMIPVSSCVRITEGVA